MAQQENQGRVKCDGGDKQMGHPAVYLDLLKSGQATCPYCGHVFNA